MSSASHSTSSQLELFFSVSYPDDTLGVFHQRSVAQVGDRQMAPVLLRTAAGSIMKFLDLKNRWLNYKVSPSSLQFQNFFPPFQLTCAATTTTSFLSLSSFQQSSEATKYATGSSVSPFQISFNFHSLCSFLLSKKTCRLLTFLS